MNFLQKVDALEALYGDPLATSLKKVADHLTPLYTKWIMASRFCVLSTVGPNGTDGSPRGDDQPVVRIADNKTLLMPDWRGNNRLDSLRNIICDGRVSLMFMVSGSSTVVRINALAKLTNDKGLQASFERKGRQPAIVIVIKIDEVYTQCSKAIIRADLWNGDQSNNLPIAGDILAEASSGEEGGPEYDTAWLERTAKPMWQGISTKNGPNGPQ